MNNFNNTEDTTSKFNPADIENNRMMGILSYIFILVLIPIIAAPKSRYARYHANQGLVLFICEIVCGMALTIISAVIGIVFGIVGLDVIARLICAVLDLVWLVFIALSVIGIVNVANGRAKELPVIGKIRLIKY